jgi:enamine deaminase RidA (YjgF/YER057c/UK114 family)
MTGTSQHDRERAESSTPGATIDDVVKSTFYVVNCSPGVIGSLAEASAAVFGTQSPVFAVPLVGVATLADPRYLAEIEATAVLP